jgi:hypothetical protein
MVLDMRLEDKLSCNQLLQTFLEFNPLLTYSIVPLFTE